MENKINIAEILKDCPKGMELDCTIYNGKVYFDGFDHDNTAYPIKISINSEFIEHINIYGQYNTRDYAKCVIFPKGKTTWEGFVPPCKFKDGDIVSTTNGIWIGIVKRPVSGACETYVTIYSDSLVYNDNIFCFERFATEEEKARLFQAIKDNGYKWNEKTKTLEKLQVTNKELQDLLNKYPHDAIVSIEYCNIRELKYIENKNLIVIE